MIARLLQFLRLPGFALWFAGQMIRANWQVAVDVLTPGSALTPGVVALRTRCRTRAELTLLSDLITLTPGTLMIDVDLGESDTFYVLGLYAPEAPEDFLAQLTGLEDRLLRVMRPQPLGKGPGPTARTEAARRGEAS